jgi:muramidase (phage lysozyme)
LAAIEEGESAMPDACDVTSANAQAFLKLIRFAEHYPDASDAFYDTLYGGGRFAGYGAHPNKAVTRWGKTSTAAGAYQILYGTWAEAKKNGLVSDFTPASQDKIAFSKLRSRGALPFVCAGDVEGACKRLVNEWTALPGAKQSRMSLAVAKDAFRSYGGAPQ